MLKVNKMDTKNIIIILCLIIVILLICASIFAVEVFKEESKLAIKDKTVAEGDSLVVILTDDGGIGLPNSTVNIKLTDENGVTVNEEVKTDSDGKAKVKVEETGKYSAECVFNGDGVFRSSSISDTVEVEKPTTELVSDDKTSTTTHSSKHAPNGGIYPEYGPEVDHYGKTREFAIANDWHYIPLVIDGKDVGGYTAIDPTTGTYHR